MTVEEVINKLKKFPPDAEVVAWNPEHLSQSVDVYMAKKTFVEFDDDFKTLDVVVIL